MTHPVIPEGWRLVTDHTEKPHPRAKTAKDLVWVDRGALAGWDYKSQANGNYYIVPAELPAKKYFLNTPENVAAFKVLYPWAKTAAGGDIEGLDGHCIVMGWFDQEKPASVTQTSLGSIAGRGYTEMDLSEGKKKPVEGGKKFPQGYFFKNTPENVAALKRDFPDTQMVYDVEIDKATRAAEFGTTGVDLDYTGIAGWYESKGLKEWEFKVINCWEDVHPEYIQQKPTDARVLKTDDPATVELLHNVRAKLNPASLWVACPSVSFFNPNPTKENQMSYLTQQDLEKAVAKIRNEMGLNPVARYESPGIASQLVGFSWRSTKATLRYILGPANKWIQNIVFVATVVGGGAAMYKGYNWATENIKFQSPVVTVEQKAAE